MADSDNVIERMFGKKPQSGYDFVFAHLSPWSPYRVENEDGMHVSEGGLLLRWMARGIGFGEISLFIKGDALGADTECMSREFCVTALRVAAQSIDGLADKGTNVQSDLKGVTLKDCVGKFKEDSLDFDEGSFTLFCVGADGTTFALRFEVRGEKISAVDPGYDRALVAAAFEALGGQAQIVD